MIVADGIYYAIGLTAGGLIVSWIGRSLYGLPFYIFAAFCLYFFRDPDRQIPEGDVAVSPADGKVVAVLAQGAGAYRVSIFLNVFDVHINRSPIAGAITQVKYQRGRFAVASREIASSENEMNTVTVEGGGTTVVFKQIAGLIARRIVFNKKTGDKVAKGERVGMIKFGSRTDVIFGPEWEIAVREGDRVQGGSSIIARRKDSAR